MMSELTRLRDEAIRLRTIYEEHQDNPDNFMRRKAHIDLDKFLMQHRDIAILLMTEGLQREIDSIVVELEYEKQELIPWYKKLLAKLRRTENSSDEGDEPTHEEPRRSSAGDSTEATRDTRPASS